MFRASEHELEFVSPSWVSSKLDYLALRFAIDRRILRLARRNHWPTAKHHEVLRRELSALEDLGEMHFPHLMDAGLNATSQYYSYRGGHRIEALLKRTLHQYAGLRRDLHIFLRASLYHLRLRLRGYPSREVWS